MREDEINVQSKEESSEKGNVKAFKNTKNCHEERKNQVENLEERSTASYQVEKPQQAQKTLWAKMDLAVLL